MMNCECKYVQDEKHTSTIQECEYDDDGHEKSWKPFLRQLLISSTVWTHYFQFGLCLGAPTVLIPRMREEKGEDYVSQEMASWMSSAICYAGLPWPPIIVTLCIIIGRRNTFAVCVITTLTGFGVLCAGESPLHVLIGMIVQGPLTASSMTITLLVLTEYTTPEYRGLFLTIKSATIFWGVWVANAIGTVEHWHYIAWLGLVCGVYNILTLFLWPESPYWLASKGRIQECRKAHKWLKGHSKNSNKELQELMRRYQKPMSVEDNQDAENTQTETETEKWPQIWLQIKSNRFYKPLLLNFALATQHHMSGKVVYGIYAIDIIKDITKSTSTAYKGMLILDGVTLLGMYTGCVLAKKITRRMLLFSAGSVSIVFLLIMSLYLFLVRFEIIIENKFLTISLLTCFSISISCGPIILNSALGAELLPLVLRSTSATIVAVFLFFLMGTGIKVAPYIFTNLGMHGAFLMYGLTSGFFLLLLYIYMPETKDKTLDEIEKLILGIKSEPEYNAKLKEMHNLE